MFSVLVTPAKAGVFIHIVKDSGEQLRAPASVRHEDRVSGMRTFRRNDMLNIIASPVILELNFQLYRKAS
jgi:hypothetical protein